MSCFIVKKDSIIKICDSLVQLKKVVYFSSTIEQLYQEINNLFDFNIDNLPFSKWYNILANEFYKLNYKAYNARYSKDENYKDIDFYILRQKDNLGLDLGIYYNSFYHFNENSLYDLCKKIDCFLYQCSEDEVIDNPICLLLSKLNKEIKIWTFEQNPAYRNSNWG